MCNVRTYVTHEYEMFSVLTNDAYENITWVKLCYTRCLVSDLILHTKMCNVCFSFPFSEFGPWHMSRPMISSILMCMQNFIKIFQKFQEIANSENVKMALSHELSGIL